MNSRKLFTVLLSFLFHIASAGTSSFVFHQLSIQDGLSESTVRCIIEDKRGYMWFGTEDGLNKYDGYKFTVYRNNSEDKYSISNNNFKCFFNDSKGRLWIGSRHGVNIYNHLQNRFYNYNSSEYPALKSIQGDLEAITEDKNGTIWTVSGEEGLYKIEAPEKPATQYTFNSKGLVKAFIYVCVDQQDGNIWVGTRDGLLKFDIRKNEFVDLRPVYGKDYQIRCILDEKDDVWLCTTEGLKRINKRTGKLTAYTYSTDNKNGPSGNNTNVILHIGGGKYVIGIDGVGINLYDKNTDSFTPYTVETGSKLSSNNITTLFNDSRGTLWAGTFLNGINFSNITTNFFVHRKNFIGSAKDIQRGIITKFMEDSKGNLWVGTDGGGLYLKKKDSDIYVQFKSSDKNAVIGADAVTDIIEDGQGDIWISTYTGGVTRWKYPGKYTIYKHDPHNPKSVCFNKLRVLYEYHNEIWVASYGEGISVFDKKTETFRHYTDDHSDPGKIPSTWVYRFLEDDKGTLWLGTFNGLVKYIPEKDRFQTYRFRETDFWGDKNHIVDIYEDSRKNLWVGTYEGGLMLFDREKEKFTGFPIEDGVLTTSVKSIIEDDFSNLWLATNNGVVQFNIPTRKAFAYTFEDGIPPCSFFKGSKFKTGDGLIYFGANDGYLIIDPRLSITATNFPKVVLTELRIFNVPVVPGAPKSPLQTDISEAKRIDLPYSRNNISIEFAALNFGIPKKNNYAYMLEGFDKEWILSGRNRNVSYTNLDPGVYTFKVKASSNAKVWGEHATSFTIVITPPFWQTWWFKGLLALVLLSGTFGVFYFRTRSIINRNKMLSQQVDERTKALKEAYDHLQQRNVEITQQQNEIIKQRNELEHLNKTKDKFFKIIGHDLKGPVRAMASLADFLNQDIQWVTDPSKREAIRHIDRSAQQVRNLVLSLLEWARTQSQEIKLNPAPIQVKKMFEENVQLHYEQASQKEIEIKIQSDDAHFFYADYNMINTVIRNILSNSIKYTRRGGTIILFSGYEGDDQLKLTIKDNGVGMAEEVLNRLFSLEKGISEKGTENETGTGLGLIICKEFVNLNRGTIYAESTVGQGSSFNIILPLSNTSVTVS